MTTTYFKAPAKLRDKAYTKLVKRCACAACKIYSSDVDPHHLMAERSMGSKAPDDLVIPLCRAHHDMLHQYGSKNHSKVLRSWGIDDFVLAHQIRTAFMNGRGDFDTLNRMRAAVMMHYARPEDEEEVREPVRPESSEASHTIEASADASENNKR